MERDNQDSSSYSVPGILQDFTLMGTPLPQAASTATKKPLLSFCNEDSMGIGLMENNEKMDLSLKNPLALYSSQPDWMKNIQPVPNENEFTQSVSTQKASLLESAYKNINEMQAKVSREIARVKEVQDRVNVPKYISASSAHGQADVWSSEFDLRSNGKDMPMFADERTSFSNSHSSASDGSNSSLRKNQISISESITSNKKKPPSNNDFEFLVPSFPVRSVKNNRLRDLPEKDVKQSSNVGDRSSSSIASSADSSLGILSPDAFEDVQEQPLTEFSEQVKLDLSQRLAKQLSLDTSNLKDSVLDISLLATERMKGALSARSSSHNKENEGTNSDYLVTTGYFSGNSTNSTAKELSIGESELSRKNSTTSSTQKKLPLTEQNLASRKESFLRKSTNSGNPFEDYSRMSVASEEFQSGEEIAERLRNDEEEWRGEFERDSIRSLSGIYGNGDISFRTQGGRLSISSFLRSGSGPLGTLEKNVGDSQRPTFGLTVVSPEKKSKPRPILPPPEDKPTFVMDEVPTKDTDPWNPQSLVEQFSVIHGQNDSDVSVPSLSCIGELLSDMPAGMTPRAMMDRLMAASRNKRTSSHQDLKIVKLDDSVLSNCGEHEKVKKRIPSVIAGGNSFCRGYESDRSTRYSSSFSSNLSLEEEHGPRRGRPADSVIVTDDSVAPSVCNVSDFNGGEEEYVCVLTPESMDFDIFNNQPRAQHYSITKACYVNDKRQDSAALIHLPVSNLTLDPGEQRVLSVTVAALVGGTIKIKLEVTRRDATTQETETNTVFGKIVAELPKISLSSPPSVNMEPVVDSNSTAFYGEYQTVVHLKNNGRSVVPIKFTVNQINCGTIDAFYLNRGKNKTVTCRLEPGQTYRQSVWCQTPPVFEISKPTGLTPVRARVDMHLATSAQVQLSPLCSVALTAHLKHNFFSAPSYLMVPPDDPVACRLYNGGSTPATLKAVATNDFTVQPSIFIINPHEKFTLQVSSQGAKKGTLTLHRVESLDMYSIKLQGGSSNTSSGLVTPQNSRGPSPTSPCSSVSSYEGNLQLLCTNTALVWGGCALQQMAVKTCSLKNNTYTHREKLVLKITDSNNCFKILNEKNCLEKEVKLCLQPMENRQVSVVMLPGTTGPMWGHLTVSRINSPREKNVLPLYAFGGKAKVAIEGVLQDPEQHMWVYLDPNTLSSAFSLTNKGDYDAFVKISEGMSATTVGGGLAIAPSEEILPPGQSKNVEISLSVTPERLEYLLAQSSQTAVCITRLTVTHGDESTRLRLNRLSMVDPKLASKLSAVNQLLPASPIPDLDKLCDPLGCGETLWLEDVSEWTVGVLVQRSALEALRLDTSIEFVDLATTMIH